MTNAGKAALSVSRPHYRNGDCVGIRHHYKKNLSCYTAFKGLKSRWNGETCIFISSERYCLLIWTFHRIISFNLFFFSLGERIFFRECWNVCFLFWRRNYFFFLWSNFEMHYILYSKYSDESITFALLPFCLFWTFNLQYNTKFWILLMDLEKADINILIFSWNCKKKKKKLNSSLYSYTMVFLIIFLLQVSFPT